MLPNIIINVIFLYCGMNVVAIQPQTVKSLCISVIPGSVMLTHTVLEGLITQSHTYYIECLKRELITIIWLKAI